MDISKAKRKKIEELILKFFEVIDPSGENKKKYQEEFDAMSDDQFSKMIKKLKTDEDFYLTLEAVPYKSEPTLDSMEAAAKIVNVRLHEYVYFKHDIDDPENPDRTRVRVPVGYLSVRRLQQLLSKKTGYNTSVDKRNQLTGQLASSNATGRLADEEVYALTIVNAEDTLKELLGPRADNRLKRQDMYRNISVNGTVSYKDLKGDLNEQPSINLLNTQLLAAGLKSDLIDNTELLKVTADVLNGK